MGRGCIWRIFIDFVNGMHNYRTRIAKDILVEFLPPTRKSRKVIILAPGAPGSPSDRGASLEFFARRGFWALRFRWRGTWESGGQFLKNDPTRDLLDVIDGLQRPLKDIWSGEEFYVQAKQIFVVGHSFGGPAAFFVTKDPRVTKVVGLSPVADWKPSPKLESLEFLDRIQQPMFGAGYRFARGKNWRMFHRGSFYNPVDQLDRIDGSKILIFQAADDDAIHVPSVRRFARRVGARLKMYKRGGHLGSSFLMRPAVYNQMIKFFKS